jgi:large subunit ribosomal protein L47
MHRIWWACLREQNRILTENFSRAAIKVGFGKYEADRRLKEVYKTQKAIKRVLVERWDAWEDARELAVEDPEVVVTEAGIEYQPLETRRVLEERDWTFTEKLARSRENVS